MYITLEELLAESFLKASVAVNGRIEHQPVICL